MITMVAAIGEKNELGKLGYGNNALWDLPDDYQRFKDLTHGHPVIMGRRTFGTMPDILEDRINIVLTRNKDFKEKGAVIKNSMNKALEYALSKDENSFIIGGGEIFKMGIKIADRMELTRIHASFSEADTFFPEFSEKNWKLIQSIEHSADDRHAYSFSFQTWERKVEN